MRFDHIGVLVGDLAEAKAFARDVLGLGDPSREFQAPEHGLAGAFFGLEQGELEMFTLADTPDARRPQSALGRVDHIAVKVDDLDAEQARLEAHGVRFCGPAHPEEVREPIELRGSRHLWTKPETSGGIMIQLIEPPKG
jgi:methylmalonyl-CoA/ethylmalonyl-CoA epimerase